MWNGLKSLHVSGRPWLVSEDFNIIRSSYKKVGGVLKPRIDNSYFNNFINECGLVEPIF